MKISTRILIGSLAPVGLVALSGWLSVGLVAHETRQNGTATAQKAAQALANSLAQQVRLLETECRTLALDPELFALLDQANSAREADPDREAAIDARDAAWRTSVAAGEQPEDLVELTDNTAARYLRRRMAELTTSEGVALFHEVFATDRYGANVAQTNPTSDFRQNDEGWWQAAAAEGVSIGDLEYDESAGVWSTAFSLAIHDRSGRFQGVLKAVAGVDGIRNLVDVAGSGVLDGSSNWIGLVEHGERLLFASGETTLGVEDVLGDWLAATADGATWIGETPRGSRAVGVRVPVATEQGHVDPGWDLLVVHDFTAADQVVALLADRVLWVAGGAVLLVVGGSLLLGWTIRRRVRLVGEVAERIGRGDLTQRVGDPGKDELAPLARAMDRMADRLEGQGEMMVRRQLSLELELQELRGAVAGSEGSRTPAALPSEGETRLPGDELLDRARALAGTGLTLEQHEQVDRILALARELRSDQDAGLATSD